MIKNKMNKLTVPFSLFFLGLYSLLAQAVPDGSYEMYILPTPIDAVTNLPDYGVDGAWNSGMFFFERPDGGSLKAPMTDNNMFVTLPSGRVMGSSIGGDGYAGHILIDVLGGVISVSTFSVDGIALDIFNNMVQETTPGFPIVMGGYIDPATGYMELFPDGREAAFVDGNEAGVWNIDDISSPSPAWVPFTTDIIANAFGTISGTPLALSGDFNGDGVADYEGVLVSGGAIGSQMGGLATIPYFETWRIVLVSGPLCATETGLCEPFPADLNLSVIESAAPILSGQAMSYSLEVSNFDAGYATDSTLVALLNASADTVINTVETSQGTCGVTTAGSGQTVDCLFDVIFPYESVFITINVTPGVQSAMLLTAEVSTTELEYDTNNNVVSISTQVLTDADGDGVEQGLDCNDNDVSIFPGAAEIVLDGVDQDCNGYDLSIQVSVAEYNAKRKTLVVTASSQLNADAALVVDGFSAMKYLKRNQHWQLKLRDVASAPATVTVRGVEGSLVVPVVIK